jgi:hypothetical protein
MDIDEPIILECKVLIESISQELIKLDINPNKYIAYYCILTCQECKESYSAYYNIKNNLLSSAIFIEDHYKESVDCEGGMYTWSYGTNCFGAKWQFNKHDNVSYLDYLKKMLLVIKRDVP